MTYSKPVSISCVSWVMFVAALQFHSSVWLRNVACSMLMYIMVLSMLLCPSTVLTWITSLVLWYSIVAFQCRKVWKVIFFILGFWSFVAVLSRSCSKVVRCPW